MNKVYELPLAPSYVAHWGLKEAIRELIQNAIDSPAEFEYAILDDGIVLRSRGVTLDPKTLVLGITSKADDDHAIGSFGEGYKIALLVLTRLGLPVAVINGDVTWQPEFRTSRQFGTELLHIVERPTHSNPDYPYRAPQDLEFRVLGLTRDQVDEVVETCLQMQPPVEDAIYVPQGRILPSHPGKLYVGGLFVCDTELEFGYDVKPEYLKLERDRQTVNNWDIMILTRDMWFETDDHDRVALLIENNAPDTRYAQYGTPNQIREACYRLFQKMHPGAIAAKTQREMEALIEKGMTKVVIVNDSMHFAVTGSQGYKEVEMVVEITPTAALQAFFDQYGKYMPRLPKVAMKKLIERSKEWRIK